ncbi:hypothetical protein QTP88_027551 [Uroleucon formosanum]
MIAGTAAAVPVSVSMAIMSGRRRRQRTDPQSKSSSTDSCRHPNDGGKRGFGDDKQEGRMGARIIVGAIGKNGLAQLINRWATAMGVIMQ